MGADPGPWPAAATNHPAPTSAASLVLLVSIQDQPQGLSAPPGPLSWGALPSSAHVGRCGRAARCPSSARWSSLEPQTFENVSVSNSAITMAARHSLRPLWDNLGRTSSPEPGEAQHTQLGLRSRQPRGSTNRGPEAVWAAGPRRHLKAPRPRRQPRRAFSNGSGDRTTETCT